MPKKGDEKVRELAEAVARRSYGKLIAFLATRTRDVAAAEDALAEAFASALSDWPKNGCPDNPEAWLLTAARRKAIDVARKSVTRAANQETVTLLVEELSAPKAEMPDYRLGLMFACAHPAIDEAIRAPLILQAVLGLNAVTIGSAFLIAPATMGQRLVRAKNKIREARIPFEIPERRELSARLQAVLDAIYSAFSEGWADPLGEDSERRELSEEALFLGSLVAQWLPNEPEALGLFSLMLHAHARRAARRGASGEFIPFSEQDMARWDRSMIAAAENALHQASALGRVGRYQLEAALQSAHAHRRLDGRENWPAILQLYDALLSLFPSPIVAINRALTFAEVHGPLAALAQLPDEKTLASYQPYWAAKAELLRRAGQVSASRFAYDLAIGLERDLAVRQYLLTRREEL